MPYESIEHFAEELSQSRLNSYQAAPHDVQEHYDIEASILAGGYSYRQLFELVQNAADAILEELSEQEPLEPAKIYVSLDEEKIVSANTGAPVDKNGVKTLLNAHSSPKRGIQIGRFGLGFKSLLRLEGKIEIIGHTGSIRFDPEKCRKRIRDELNLADDAPAPGMRLAETIECSELLDDTTRSRFDWATTIIAAQINDKDARNGLINEFKRFPKEFLLFLPADIELTLDTCDSLPRRLIRKKEGSRITLQEGTVESQWLVSNEEKIRIDEKDSSVIKDATHVHGREHIPIIWASNVSQRDESAGKFWSFFPTETPTHLAGILNAPWKLNSDRTAVIPGAWNTFLMQEAAKLVVKYSKEWVEGDPARAIDFFPRELDSKVAAPLANAVWNNLILAEVIPDANGELRKSTDLNRHPTNSPQLVDQWVEIADTKHRSKLVHSKCLQRNRLGRLQTLAKHIENLGNDNHLQQEANQGGNASPNLKEMSHREWFSCIASQDIERHKKTLQLAREFLETIPGRERRDLLQDLEIVPVKDGDSVTFHTPNTVAIAPSGAQLPGRAPVHPELAADTECRQILTGILEVPTQDDTSIWITEFEELIQQSKFDEFWTAFRTAPDEVRSAFASNRNICIRCEDGNWKNYRETLEMGHIITENDKRKYNLSSVVLDQQYHHKDLAWLRKEIKIGPCPHVDLEKYSRLEDAYTSDEGALLYLYNEAMCTWYRASLSNNQRPQRDYLRPLNPFYLPRGWSLMRSLKATPLAKLTHHLLKILNETPDKFGVIRYGHATRNIYEKRPVLHPLYWLLDQLGLIICGECTVPFATLRMARNQYEQILGTIPDWERISSVIDTYHVHCPEGLPIHDTDDLTPLWPALFSLILCKPETLKPAQIRLIYRLAAKNNAVPDEILTMTGPVSLGDVYVSTSENLVRKAEQKGVPTFFTDPETLDVWKSEGAKLLDNLFKPTWEQEEVSVPLLEMFHEIRSSLVGGESDQFNARRCSNLQIDISGQKSSISCFLQNRTLLVDSEKFEELSHRSRLEMVLNELYASGCIKGTPETALQSIMSDGALTRRKKIADEPDLEKRVLAVVGNRVDLLLDKLIEPIRQALEDNPRDELEVAAVALAIHGPSLLFQLREAMKEEGLEPPNRWGTKEAKEFVQHVGFPSSFAANPRGKRPAEEIISGPMQLSELHGFQCEILDEIRKLFENGGQRVVVSLPTGGGKTRVVAESAVRLALAMPDRKNRSVLWIAQTDELCEQAVQCFRQVWSNLGIEGENLRIVRLWGSNPALKN